MFSNAFKSKRVLLTGHTGFKGSWLSIWLKMLGAEVIGFSDCIPTVPSHFEATSLEKKLHHIIGDIRDYGSLLNTLRTFKPDFVFHLAAQAIVSTSYMHPVETISTNVIGTAQLLEALRHYNQPCTAIFITSDKCYENVEWPWGYKETDALGGRDIYSGSKGAAEIIIHSYFHSFFKSPECRVRIATGRAGNVIGGGDWAKDRIVADCMRNWSEGEPVEIRSPSATRPWQHVLEPLSGYLALASELSKSDSFAGESFNFGPRSEQNRTVLELLKELGKYWNFDNTESAYRIVDNIPFHEAGLLKLNCDKALFHLKWSPTLEYEECVKLVSEWYFQYYKSKQDMYEFTAAQIKIYEDYAVQRELPWAC